MKATVKAVFLPGKTRATLHIYIKREDDEVFNMGNSSFLLNYTKGSLDNPTKYYERKKYSTGIYEPIEVKEMIDNRTVGIQLRMRTPGRAVSNKFEKICTVKFDQKISKKLINLSWRSIDTDVVTPTFIKVDTNYIITQ